SWRTPRAARTWVSRLSRISSSFWSYSSRTPCAMASNIWSNASLYASQSLFFSASTIFWRASCRACCTVIFMSLLFIFLPPSDDFCQGLHQGFFGRLFFGFFFGFGFGLFFGRIQHPLHDGFLCVLRNRQGRVLHD